MDGWISVEAMVTHAHTKYTMNSIVSSPFFFVLFLCLFYFTMNRTPRINAGRCLNTIVLKNFIHTQNIQNERMKHKIKNRRMYIFACFSYATFV